MPTPSCNGFESAIARAFRSATEEQICLVATVRLVTPQFLKVSPGWQQGRQHRERTGERTWLWLGVGDDISLYFGKIRYKAGAAFEKRWFCDGVYWRAQPGKLQDKVTSLHHLGICSLQRRASTTPLCKEVICIFKHWKFVSWPLPAGL